MSLIIETRTERKNGLETYSIYVNGTELNTFMSKQAAETKKQQIIFAWNIEKVGQTNIQRKGKAA